MIVNMTSVLKRPLKNELTHTFVFIFFVVLPVTMASLNTLNLLCRVWFQWVVLIKHEKRCKVLWNKRPVTTLLDEPILFHTCVGKQ